ncbi:MAG: DUF456 domain-containing protein [Anaerolineales bacterium]|nr:DUF456 domain-containing protein [Anaerolineales bacterium]MCX7754207.1 DUF456 domain-containing protein [Anaerolineales bacterium]MDW8276943.1 DUF456 domain-containing protein [Anaerolineales bacterium]
MNIPLFGEILMQALTLTFMLVGLAGLLIPIFPGIAVIWLAAVVYMFYAAWSGLMTGWDWFLFALITLLAAVGGVIDNIIITAKLRETGTPWRSIGIGLAVGLVSSCFLTPLAALLITPLTLYLVEYLRLREARAAFDSAKGWLVGFGWTFLALFAIGILMIGFWLLWVLV